MVELKRPDGMLPLVKQRRISIPLSEAAFRHINELAWRHRTSVAYLGQLAVVKLLLSDVRGEFSLVPEFQPDQEIPRA